MPALASDIVAAEQELLNLLDDIGHPLANIIDRRAAINRSENTMSVTLKLEAGPFVRFGSVAVEGLTDVEEDYVRELIQVPSGTPYDQREVDALRSRLVNTNLFDSVRIDHASSADSEGRLPMVINVAERKHRSIGAGVSFSTDEGAGANAFWEHRNLFARNEQFRFSVTAAQIRQVLSADYRVPNFRRLDQALIFNSTAVRQTTDAFEELSASFFGGLERKLGEHWTVRAGPSLEYSILDDNVEENTFALVGFPLSVARDDTDDVLNPTRGTRLNLTTTPYYGVLADNPSFLVNEVSGSGYFSLFENDRLVLAARSRFGSIIGASTDDIPVNKRFFAGGGGSIRGFEFQTAGPLDEDNDPIGGRSVFELNLEVRVRITDTIGLVPFVDSGTVFDSSVPDFSGETPRLAAGVGARYFTVVGPLRVDIAFPLNPRDGVDDFFQFYISIGQAF
jgi:translocation and assembly module TamA